MLKLLESILSNWQLIIGTLGTIVMGASIAVRAIAPHTTNTLDDRASEFLGYLVY